MSFGNMMNGTGGIGQKVDSLSGRSQPELQKQYADSVDTGVPDVATLIALNMMRTDLKAKEAEVRLAMQPKEPGTVLEQRAAELKNMAVGQNTTDVATNVGDGIAKKLRDEQNNMRRMAQGTQGPPQGIQMAPQGPPQGPPQGATQMAASGGIIMQGAPNLQRMAGGGIVGFNPGGAVMPSAEQLKELGVTEAEWLALNRREKRDLLSPVGYERGLLDSIKQFLTPKNPVLRDTSDGAIQPTRPQFRTDVDDPGQAPSIGPGSNANTPRSILRAREIGGNAAPNTQRRPFSGPLGVAPEPVVQPSAQTPAQGRPTLGPFGPFNPSATGTNSLGPGVDVNPNALRGIAQARVPELGQAPVPRLGQAKAPEGITNAFDISATRAGKLIGRDPKAAQRAAMLERYKAANIEAENLRKKTELPDTFAFSGGTGFGAGAVEVANRRSKLASAKDARLRNELGLEEINIKGDVDIAGKQITAGESAAKAGLEKLGRDQLLKFKKATAQASSKMEKRKVYIDIVKAIADLRQKNLQAVGKDLAGRADILQLNREVQEGKPGAEKKLEAIYKAAEERASRQTTQVLTELEGIRRDLAREAKGFGSPTPKK